MTESVTSATRTFEDAPVVRPTISMMGYGDSDSKYVGRTEIVLDDLGTTAVEAGCQEGPVEPSGRFIRRGMTLSLRSDADLEMIIQTLRFRDDLLAALDTA
jgi:hypothetical protein